MERLYTIILVEDSEAHKELIFRIFEGSVLPVRLIWAESILKAKAIIDIELPDLVLADWRLNDGDGIELLSYSQKRFPLLLMTSFGNEELAVNSMKAGVMDYIVKSKEAFEKLPTVIMRVLREWENIVAREQAEQAMEISEERYRLATDGANDIIWDWDILSDQFYMSKAWVNLGDTESHGYILSLNEFISMIDSEDRDRAKDEIKNYINGQTEYYTSEYKFVLFDSSIKWGLIKGKGLKNDRGEVIRIAGSLTDITERKLYEKRIEELAFKDSLTGLPNRASLYDKLDQLSLKNQQEMLTTVFHIDIDNFKIINDLYGHRFGDSFIMRIASELMDISEPEWFLSRSGGDEFTLIIDNIDSLAEIRKYAEKIQKCINKNITVFNQNLDMTCSIGIYIYPEFSVSADEIFKNVDLAMYKAKKDGKNRFVYFDNWMNEEIIKQVEFEHRLRDAINKNEFVLYYQPQFNLVTEEFYGFEALIRWNSPIYGMVPPLKFIPIAEETGLIVPIGLWVLKTAASFAEKLYELNIKGMHISINVSPVQLLQADFVDSFINRLKGFEAQIGNLGIEITESSMIENFETNTEKLLELKKLGFIISLDDFGTGYSSLNYLNKLPIDVVKLDKSFIDNIETEVKKFKLSTFIISLAHSMGLKVVAEGIETEQQRNILKSNGCDIAQGYLISKPIPEQEALKYIIELTGGKYIE